MLKHFVGWTLKEEAIGKSKAQNLNEMVERIKKLEQDISHIKKLELGVNANDSAIKNLDICFTMDFDGMKEHDMYQVHPAHQEFVQFVRQIRDKRVAIDYYIND